LNIVVVAGGGQPEQHALKVACEHADCVMAADSGATCLHAWGLRIDVLLGDFDSLAPDILAALQANGHTRWVRHRVDKDQTDMELCVEEAFRLGVTEARFFGALGTRMDHTLANLALLYPFAMAGIPAWVEDGHNRVTLMAATKKPGETGRAPKARMRLMRQDGFKVSLVSLPPGVCAVETTGLRYDMAGRDLPFGSTLAVSNEFDAPEAEISFSEGMAWLLLSHD
jgi:thiamine pyrophosphokinase